MTISRNKIFFFSLLAAAALVGCGDDDDNSGSGDNGGSASTSTTTTTTTEENGGGSGTTTTTTTTPPETAECPNNKGKITGSIDESCTLTADQDWTISGLVTVEDGAILTIEAGTTIYGESFSKGTLVINRGAQIYAKGTAEEPIVFTSEAPVGERQPGDWGGIILLGKATHNYQGEDPSIEGLTGFTPFGGTDDADSSGTMEYVRIEYPGIDLGDGNEINGLTFGGVGSGTVISHVQVTGALDDCFEWFGGTVNADHLIANNCGDDMIDMDRGFRGHLQFIFGRSVRPETADPNGFEADSGDKKVTGWEEWTPVSAPMISNVTLCGPAADVRAYSAEAKGYGAKMREGFAGNLRNVLLMGWDNAVHVADMAAAIEAVPANKPDVDFTVSIQQNEEFPVGTALSGDAWANDEGETVWTAGDENSTTAISGLDIDACRATDSSFALPMPATAIAGEAPGTGLDADADYIGAFEDENDDWTEGWTDFTFDDEAAE